MEVIFGWMKDNSMPNMGQKPENVSVPKNSALHNTGKRKHKGSEHASSALHPVDEILLWHKAIRLELQEIAEAARKIQCTFEFSDLSAFNLRLQFIADICIYHRYLFASEFTFGC
jgi:hypothetical protein